MTAIMTAQSGIARLATTGNSGFALQDATPTILTWTAPADGNIHRVTLFASLSVSSTLTGGAVKLEYTDPGGENGSPTMYGGGQGAGSYQPAAVPSVSVGSGTTVNLVQTSVASGGAATLYAELWGS